MVKIESFKQANESLAKYVPKDFFDGPGRYNLKSMRKLLDVIDNPQNDLRFIHIAGTSGKTSTSYYIASYLKQMGFDVGLTVSPHISEINERIQINLTPLNEQDFCNELGELLDIIESSNISPTYFEILIALAYRVFSKLHLEYAVIEVGLGGLLDGTNVIDRADKVCVLTDIGLDHTKILGSTLKEIAFQKAGIIHNDNDVFIYDQPSEVMNVVKDKCDNTKARLKIIDSDYLNWPVNIPDYQKRNMNLARKVVEFVINRDHSLTIKPGIDTIVSQTIIPARMETIVIDNKTIIMDGAHNQQKTQALVSSYKKIYPNRHSTLLVSFGENKRESIQEAIELLSQISDSIILTTFSNWQDETRLSVPAKELAKIAKNVGFQDVTIVSDPKKALKVLIDRTKDIGLITGSFYLIAKVRPQLISGD